MMHLIDRDGCSVIPDADQALADGFQGGIDLVLRETDLPLRALPVVCPLTLEASLDPATLCDTRADWSDLVG